MKNSNIINSAREFATQAHKRIDHRRKYSNQPYDIHLKAVADIIKSITDDPETICAAWLHDVVEDTPATFHDVEKQFGKTIAQLVSEVTDVSKTIDGNRAVRKAIDREHLASASPRAKTIKLADIIDNCQDIYKHDQRFARTYLAEIVALMEVITEGDNRLYKKATKVINACSKKLGLSLSVISIAKSEEEYPAETNVFSAYRAQQMFMKAFSAKDIAEPLRSFDGEKPCSEVLSIMSDLGIDVAGINHKGLVEGYLIRTDLKEGLCKEHVRQFRKGQVITGEASLSEVIQVLTRHEYCFISVFGSIFGVTVRFDIQKPIVRMWLFGMITFIEMVIVDRIRDNWPDDSWKELISETRLQKAESLLKERQRRRQRCNLLDCLQLSDKAGILIEDMDFIKTLGFKSKRAAKQVIKELESLRNNLAHAQDIVAHDWPQISRMTQRFESALTNLKK